MRQRNNKQFELQRYNAIIFDFDGTLVPCLDLRAMKERVLSFTISETGIARKLIEPMMMVEFIDYAHKWLELRGRGGDYFDSAHRLVKEIELAAAADTRLFPGTDRLLEELRNRGMKIGVVTRNCEQAVTMMFPSIKETCSSVIARERARHLKPDPRHLQQCLDELKVPASQALMVGDGIIDIEIAHALNMESLAVLSGHNSDTELNAAHPTWVMDHVNDLKMYL
ncbi:MAG: HAD family hydrolase [Gammaproteobacteria bacterium]